MENETSQKEVMERIQKILEERGREALEMARKTVLEEEIESKEIRKALKYFLTDYWHDVARPAILSLACEAVGGDPTVTTPIAISMTLISGAIDIHDDVIDGSENKGSLPTVLGKFGKDIALLVGDALLFKGFTTLYEAVEKGIPAKKVAVINDIIKRTFFELGDAEALELEFRGQIDITPEEYLNIVRKKAADVEAHTRISAILGDGTKEEVEALSHYGRLLGMLIILRDDIIDMIDIEESMHRIKKEHLTLPVIYAVQNPKINSEISLLLSKKITTKNDVKKLLALVVRGMGFDRVEEYMKGLAQDAYTQVERIKNNKQFFLLLVRRMLLPEWRRFV